MRAGSHSITSRSANVALTIQRYLFARDILWLGMSGGRQENFTSWQAGVLFHAAVTPATYNARRKLRGSRFQTPPRTSALQPTCRRFSLALLPPSPPTPRHAVSVARLQVPQLSNGRCGALLFTIREPVRYVARSASASATNSKQPPTTLPPMGVSPTPSNT